jgi:hypothetical protein
MSALPAGALAGLRAGLSALYVQTLSYQARTAGSWPTAVNFAAVVTSDSDGQVLDAPVRSDARTITVRPTASILPVNIGDRIIYGGETYIVNAIDGSDIQRIIAVKHTMNGVQGNDKIRFQGT